MYHVIWIYDLAEGSEWRNLKAQLGSVFFCLKYEHRLIFFNVVHFPKAK